MARGRGEAMSVPKVKVLIVDDKADERKFLSRIFVSGATDYRVIEAGSGIQALEAAKEAEPDIVISDILMPGMDGFMMLRQMRTDPEIADIPVVFYTGHYVGDRDRELARKLGVARFIIKPCNPDRLLSQITKVMDDYGAGKLAAPEALEQTEEEYLRHYSERVVKKLEDTIGKLESEALERRKAEQELKKTYRLFEAVIEGTTDAVYVKDLQGRYLTVNSSVSALINLSRDQAIGMTDLNVFPREDAEKIMRNDMSVLMSGEAATIEETVFIQGEERIFLSTKAPYRDQKGRVIGLAGISREITSRKRAEFTLADSETRFRALFEASFEGIAVIAGDKVIETNPALMEMFGYSKDELLGKPIGELLKKEDQAQAKDGSMFTVEVQGRPIVYGGAKAQVITCRNVTQREQEKIRLRERANDIRRAYAEVFSAVTGERLLILSPEEIGPLLGKAISPRFPLHSFADLAPARAMIREIVPREVPNIGDAHGVILAGGEAAANAIKHAGEGELQLMERDGVLQLIVEDHGPGIDFGIISKATLLHGFSTKPSLGIGFTVMLETAERLLLSTQPGNTIVVLEFDHVDRPLDKMFAGR